MWVLHALKANSFSQVRIQAASGSSPVVVPTSSILVRILGTYQNLVQVPIRDPMGSDEVPFNGAYS